ncbi:hypothetical protein EYF88_13470 [Paracoccus sediminis]|uniref:Transposase IS116/IS110/IS902 family protein n=1 Tax=Paracoccus sediminis TaxID=1214787 RepID=A0ABY1YJ57_9RHOB|nr:hypothetical protein [Paracoccus sediminis]TBN48510.1 hypothetical protein EYF88_13470 [Paracoccus sediminis]
MLRLFSGLDPAGEVISRSFGREADSESTKSRGKTACKMQPQMAALLTNKVFSCHKAARDLFPAMRQRSGIFRRLDDHRK